jgi:hypothetical protein
MQLSALFTIPKMKERQAEFALHCARQAAALVIPLGCERGVWLPLPDGALPQVCLLWLPPLAVPGLAPVGFEAVGTTAGTLVQALSYTMRFVLDCLGTEAAATENSMH